jgi:CcmD family protein
VTYLFWAFAAVWIGLFAYVYLLIRRTDALWREVRALEERSRSTADAPGGAERRVVGARRAGGA